MLATNRRDSTCASITWVTKPHRRLVTAPTATTTQPVPTVLNPLLLWGLAAVAAPILIHLLLRQRPKPRPWAAMRWLQAASQAASRRFKLTNLLLLLLRCLVVAALAMALARPQGGGGGHGGHLVLIIDCTASMGPRGSTPGDLAAAMSALTRAEIPHGRITIATLGETLVVRPSSGRQEALAVLTDLRASGLPGGLERAVSDPALVALQRRIDGDSDVLLISDFRQDDASSLLGLVGNGARSARRWRVGDPGANAVIAGISPAGDQQPDRAATRLLHLDGEPDGALLQVGEQTPGAASLGREANGWRLGLPALPAGRHRLTVSLTDTGLRYDDHLELAMTVRNQIEAVVVADSPAATAAALGADDQRLAVTAVTPNELSTWPLPEGGLVVLRTPTLPGDGARLAAWVANGGTLWTSLDLVINTGELDALTSDMPLPFTTTTGGVVTSGDRELDSGLAAVALDQVMAWQPPSDSRVLLRAGDQPLVAAWRHGHGRVILESMPLARIPALTATWAWPWWVRAVAREQTALAAEPPAWRAGEPAPATIELTRDGRAERVIAGQPLLLAPGLWQDPNDKPVLVLANREEGRLGGPTGTAANAATSAASALPQRAGGDWGLWLVALVLGLALVEGWAGARAAKAYNDG